jgi:hypothetical protein
MSNPLADLSPEDSERVKQIRLALEQEMSEAPGTSRSTVKEVEELKEDALSALKYILKHTDNNSLKGKVGMWVIDTLIAANKDNADNDLTKLIKGMQEVHETSA